MYDMNCMIERLTTYLPHCLVVTYARKGKILIEMSKCYWNKILVHKNCEKSTIILFGKSPSIPGQCNDNRVRFL